jgi:hypothetical protein
MHDDHTPKSTASSLRNGIIPDAWLAPASVVIALERSTIMADPRQPGKKELYCQTPRELALILDWFSTFDGSVALSSSITHHLKTLGRINRVSDLLAAAPVGVAEHALHAANDDDLPNAGDLYQLITPYINTMLMPPTIANRHDTILFGATLPATLANGLKVDSLLAVNEVAGDRWRPLEKGEHMDDAVHDQIAAMQAGRSFAR